MGGYTPYVRFQCESVAIRIQIWGCKPYVPFQWAFRSISRTNLRLQTPCSCFVRFLSYFAYKSEVTNPMFVFGWISAVFWTQMLQTLCSFSVRFLQSFAYKSEVTNPVFVFSAISVVFRIQSWGYKPCVRVSWLMQYFEYKSEVTNPMFVFRVIYASICLQAYVHRHEF